MMPSQESLKVLQMIEQGQITAEEGIRLLNTSASTASSEASEPAVPAVPEPAPLHAPEHIQAVPGKGWLRVRVTDTVNNRNKVTVNLPLSLMAAGIKIGAHFAPELNGVDFTDVFQELRATQPGKIIDVLDEEDGEHVEIFVE